MTEKEISNLDALAREIEYFFESDRRFKTNEAQELAIRIRNSVRSLEMLNSTLPDMKYYLITHDLANTSVFENLEEMQEIVDKNNK